MVHSDKPHQGVDPVPDAGRGSRVVPDEIRAERKRLAEEIEQRRRTEQHARSVIDSALDGVISMDTNGCIVAWNAQAEIIFGWTRAEVIGRELASLIIPAQYSEAHRAGLARYQKNGEGPVLGQRLEMTALRKDGTEFPIEFSVVEIRLDDTVLFNAFLRDITQRSEDAEYRARMAALVDSSYDAIIGKDVDGTIISWNAGAERVYGYGEEEAVGRTTEIILPPGIDEEEPEILRAVEAGQRVDQFETIRRRKDGLLIPVSVTVSPIADERGAIIGSSTIERDVTERKRAEIADAEHKRLMALRVEVSTALAANQTRRAALQQCAQALVDHLGVAFARVWTLDEQTETLKLQASAGMYTHLDGAHRRIKMGEYKIGRIAQNRKPHLTNDVLNDPNISSPEWAKQAGMVAFAGYPLLIGESVLGVVALFARTKLSQTILSQLIPLADGIAQYLERKRSEKELRKAKDAAETAARARAEFLANVSHELRTPMNAIIGMTEIALGETLTSEVRGYLQTADESAHSLLTLLNDILDFSKLEAGKFSVENEPFSLYETVDETVKALSARAFEKGLELACEIAFDVPDELVGDALRIRQLLTNMIGNAIKFTEQGEVIVRVETLQSWPQAARLRFAVVDTGIGISTEDQQRILEPFTQVDASSTRHYGGTGLGLTICNELLSIMGSHLSMESEVGKGSCFSFELSLPRATERSDDPADVALLGRLKNMPVLVVDDNETNRRILEKTLKNWSMRPQTASNGQEALDLLGRARDAGNPFPIVIVDALMPGMDGYMLSHQIVKGQSNPPPVILMASSSDRQEFKDRETDAHVAIHLQKPVSQFDLMDAVMRAMNVQLQGAEREVYPVMQATNCQPLSVLLAEDTPANQNVVTSILQKRGHAVCVAQNGREAVELFRKQAFDVVLMDVQMPIMDGYQATAAIRDQEKGCADPTPIVAMTAHAMRGDREKCLSAGMDDYVAKPIAVKQLIEIVESVARNKCEPASEEAIVDFQGAMQRLGGDMELYREFIDYFDEDSPRLLSTLQQAIAGGDAAVIERAAHSLKGLAANFGAEACVAVAHELELAGKAGALDGAGGLYSRLERQVARLHDALETHRQLR